MPPPRRLLAPKVPTGEVHRHVLTVTALGKPIGQGRISSYGKGHTVHSNAKTLLPWRERLYFAARAAVAHQDERTFPIDGPVAAEISFTLDKPITAPVRRRTWPTRRPDLDHLVRAALDALTKVVWTDDARVIDVHTRKCYPGEHPAALHTAGVVITVYAVEPEESDEAVPARRESSA